jgi:hypothetical protein
LLLGVAMLVVFTVGGVLAYRYLSNRVVAVGGVSVASQPSGARIAVDGEARGYTPAELTDLPVGSYQLKISLTGYREEQRSVEVAAGAVARLSVDLQPLGADVTTGAASFVSAPAGATVTVDGEERGITPLELPDLEPGEHQAEISLSGYRAWSGSFEVEVGGTAVVEASLERLRRRTASATPEPTPEPTP